LTFSYFRFYRDEGCWSYQSFIDTVSEQQWQQADAIGMLIGMLIGMRALLEGSRAEKSEEAKVGRAGGADYRR
jgi:hypothetical protein